MDNRVEDPPVSERTLVGAAEINELEMMSRLTECSRTLLEDANEETSDCADCVTIRAEETSIDRMACAG